MYGRAADETLTIDYCAPKGDGEGIPVRRQQKRQRGLGRLFDEELAIRYTRHNAKQWNSDPNEIALIGGSTDGFLSNMVGLLNVKSDQKARGPVDRESARVQAVVTLFAQSGFAPRFR